MANDFTSNPWVIDTAGATILTTDRIRVRTIRWIGGASGLADDQCVVQDKNGKVKYEAFAFQKDANDESFVSDAAPANYDGLKVPTMTHGKLYIYLR